MNHIETYSNLLRIRSKFKRLQQLSWNISKLEQGYKIEDMDKEDYKFLHEAYISLIGELNLIYNELKDEGKVHKE